MEKELAQAAAQTVNTGNTGEKDSTWMEKNQVHCRKENWEVLMTKREKPKIRKPIKITTWFADEPGTGNTSTTDTSEDDTRDENEPEWKTIARKEIRKKKNMERKNKKKERMEELCTKMKHTIGIGPIAENSIKYFEKVAKDRTKGIQMAVEEFLIYFLDYDREELKEIKILDMKMANQRQSCLYCSRKDRRCQRNSLQKSNGSRHQPTYKRLHTTTIFCQTQGPKNKGN